MSIWKRFLVWILPQWRWDEHNPYRRSCRYCGQTQSQYGYAAFPRSCWWEDTYPVMARKPECDVVHPEE